MMKTITTRIGLLALVFGTLFFVDAPADVIEVDLKGKGGITVDETTGRTIICRIFSTHTCSEITLNESTFGKFGPGFEFDVMTEEGPRNFTIIHVMGPLVPNGENRYSIPANQIIVE